MGAGEIDFLYLVVAAFTVFGITLAWAAWFTGHKR